MSTKLLRYLAAALAAITAVFYFLIAAHVLPVADDMDTGVTVFGLIAGCGFLLLAVALVVIRRRFVWTWGALLQIFAIVMYFVVGRNRVPHYEIWGLLMRIPQVLILAALGYLSLSTRGQKRSEE